MRVLTAFAGDGALPTRYVTSDRFATADTEIRLTLRCRAQSGVRRRFARRRLTKRNRERPSYMERRAW